MFGSGFSSEGNTNFWDAREIISQATWSSPVTNKLLLEAGYATFLSRWGWQPQPGMITNLVQMTTVVPTFQVYRGVDNILDNSQNPNTWRASATYVTGAHNMKFGYQGAYHIEETTDLANDRADDIDRSRRSSCRASYSAEIRIAPWQQSNRTAVPRVLCAGSVDAGTHDAAGRARYDRAWSWFPAEHNGAPQASRWNAAPITFPKTDGVTGYNDITPRGGFAYDVFGNGKTSLKVNVGKYLQSANNQENYTISNPALDGRNGRRGPNFQTTAHANVHRLRRRPRCRTATCSIPAPNGECIAPDSGTSRIRTR